MKNIVIVFARDLDCASRWAIDKGFKSKPAAKNGWLYGSEIGDVDGRSGFDVAVLPSFHNVRSRLEKFRRSEIVVRINELVALGNAKRLEIQGDY